MKAKFIAVLFFFLLLQKVIRLIPGLQFTWYWYIYILGLTLPYAALRMIGRISRLDGLVLLYVAGTGMCVVSNWILGNTAGIEYFALCFVLPVGCWAFFREWGIREEDLEGYIAIVSICLSIAYLYDFLGHNVFRDYRLFDYDIMEKWDDGRARGTPYNNTRALFGKKVFSVPGITGVYQATGVFYVALFLYHYMCRHVTKRKAANYLGGILALTCGLVSFSGTAYLVLFLVAGAVVFWPYRWLAAPAVLCAASFGALLLKNWSEPDKSWGYIAAGIKGIVNASGYVFDNPLSLILGDPGRTFGTAIALIDMVFQMGVLTYGLYMSVLILGIITCAKRFDRIGGGIGVMAAAMILGSLHYDSVSLHPTNMILFSLVGLASARLRSDSATGTIEGQD